MLSSFTTLCGVLLMHLAYLTPVNAGHGGYVTIINGTPYAFRKGATNSADMAWYWPDVVHPGTTQQSYFEFLDDGCFGEQIYHLALNRSYHYRAFQIVVNGYAASVQVKFIGHMESQNNPINSTIDLQWDHDIRDSVSFALSGTVKGGFSSTNPPVNWMSSNLPLLGHRMLREISMIGSHDAGMGIDVDEGHYGTNRNSRTQPFDITGQLQLGAHGDYDPYWTTSHGSVNNLLGWIGSIGQGLDQIISELNDFLATNAELVILELSHGTSLTQTYSFYGNDWDSEDLDQNGWTELMAYITANTKNLFIAPPDTADLTTMKLNDFIGTGVGAVVVIVENNEGAATTIDLGDYAGRGFYTYQQYTVTGSYSNTNNLTGMEEDQFTKLKLFRAANTSRSQDFEEVWTLTQDTSQSVSPFADSIIELSYAAKQALWNDLFPECGPYGRYPNIIEIDNIDTSQVTALAMAINTYWANYHLIPQHKKGSRGVQQEDWLL